MRILIFIGQIIFSAKGFGQKHPLIFPKHVGEREVGAFFALAGQNSLYQNRRLSITGFRTGVVLHGVHKIGFGYNEILRPQLYQDPPCCDFEDLGGPHEIQYQSVDFIYERTIYKGTVWEWTLPCLIDIGRGVVTQFSPSGTQEVHTGGIITSRIELQNRVFVVPYAALKWAAGYRIAFTQNLLWSETLNTAYLNLGVSVDLLKLWRAMKGEAPWWQEDSIF